MLKLIFLLLFSSFFFLWKLGGTYLTNWDEAWYAGISRSMLERGDFIVPYWNGASYFDKGPFYHWLSIIAYKFFPSWELAARLPSALAAVGCVMLVYLLAKVLFSSNVGIISALILSSTVGFLYRSRTGNLDSLSTFFILLSFLSFFIAQKKPKYFLLLGVSLSLLLLVKSGLVFYPIFVLISYMLWHKDLKPFKNRFFVLGAILAVIIPSIWLALGTQVAGKHFFDFYVNLFFWPVFKFDPASGGVTRFSLSYVLYLFHGIKIWSLFIAPAFLLAIFKACKNKSDLFLLLAFIPYFLILLATKEAGDWYLLPLYPIVALIIARFLILTQEKFLAKKQFLLLIFISLLAFFQNIYYHSLFIVPESVQNEVELSTMAKNLTFPSQTIIVDDYYFPVASFYGERKIKVVRRGSSDTSLVLSQSSFYRMLTSKESVVILTTTVNFSQITKDLKDVNFKVEKQAGEHLLVIKL